MIGGDNPVLFTHVVLVLHDTVEVHAVMDQIFSSLIHGNTSVVVVSDPSQKKELIREAPVYDYDQLHADRRLQFIYRPLKPSKFAVIFDPQKERESSTDRNQDSAQQVVVSQKLVFEELKRRVGGKGHKVLLVEDNKINQTVIHLLGQMPISILTICLGGAKVPCQDQYRHRDCVRRCPMYGHCILKATWLLLNHSCKSYTCLLQHTLIVCEVRLAYAK